MKRQNKQDQPLVTLRGVTLQIGSRRVFENANWAIHGNEHWALTGPNGSGKSALARSLHGDIAVVGGEITYPGDESEMPEGLIAHISFEDHRDIIAAKSPYYQSRWNSSECCDAPTVSDMLPDEYRKSRRGGGNVMERLGIDHLLDRKITRLSNGEMRKSLIAEALAQEPRILVLDDPYVGLDHRSRRALRKMIEELIKENTCIVFITSRIDEIPAGITHVLSIDDGRIVAGGDRKSVLGVRPAKKQSAKRVHKISPRLGRKRTRARSAPERSKLIEAKNVSVTYDGLKILSRINWTMLEGENWAVLGPNGAGKTTLLSLILGDNPQAYSNDIHLFGRKRGSGESIWEIKKNIGWVSPEMQIHYQKAIKCHDVVCSGFFDSIGLHDECSARRQRLASSWIRDLGLSDLVDINFDELSAGQQRMILMARALVKNPRLLVLDEPCQGLDPENRKTVLKIVDAVGRRGASNLIYITHRLDEMPRSITHVLRLRNGRITRKGKRGSVLGK